MQLLEEQEVLDQQESNQRSSTELDPEEGVLSQISYFPLILLSFRHTSLKRSLKRVPAPQSSRHNVRINQGSGWVMDVSHVLGSR